MNAFLSPAPLWQANGVALVRIITGLLMVYHGQEVFNSKLMAEYATWDSFKNYASPWLIVYLGKGSEFAIGVLLTLGLFTRLAALWLMATMLFIVFFVGHGKFWYEDQHPFMFALIGLLFIFCGPGRVSVDGWLFGSKARYISQADNL